MLVGTPFPVKLSAFGALGRKLWSRCSPSRTHSRKGRIAPQNMKRDGTIVPPRSELPLLGSNQDSPDPMPLRLSPPPVRRAFVVWTVPSPSPLRGQAAPTQSLHLPLAGLGSALPVKGSPTSRAFTHVVSDVVSSECTLRCGQSQACCQLHQGAASYHSKAGTARLQLTRREEVTPQPRYISSLPLLNPPALCTIQRAACGARRHSTCNPARGSRSAVSGQRPEPPAGPSTLELRAAR